jgi:type VI secretion system secreted protein VgrG
VNESAASVEDLLQRLLDRLEHRYHGKYRGYVHRTDDPLKLGRVQAVVPRLCGDTPLGWALPCSPYAGPDQGLFLVPEIGSGVWIEFEGGDLASPIWSGMWWGAPDAADVGQPDSTASEHRVTPEVPQHNRPRETAVPGVRMLKSASGHHIVLDDREDSRRVEIHDSLGNRLIFSKEGKINLVSNERTVNSGNRSEQVDQSDSLRVGRNQTTTIGGSQRSTVGGDVELKAGGSLLESARDGAYKREFTHEGLKEAISGPRTTRVSGSDERRVTGATKEVATGGYGVVAGGAVNINSGGGSVSISASLPDLPSLNAISLDAALGNVSINTKLGLLQLGGLSAVSPLVVGDGLLIQLTILVQILKTINPLTVAGYGPALDAWLATTPISILSLFGFVKRFPVG